MKTTLFAEMDREVKSTFGKIMHIYYFPFSFFVRVHILMFYFFLGVDYLFQELSIGDVFTESTWPRCITVLGLTLQNS